MYPPDVFRSTLVRLLDGLERLGVRCHATGGVTSVAYGEPRMTQDIDLVVDNAALGRVLPAFVKAVGEAASSWMQPLCERRRGTLWENDPWDNVRA